MNILLNEYLLTHRELPLDGMGVLRASLLAAQYDVTERAFAPPSAVISFEPFDAHESVSMQPLVRFVAQQLHLSEEDAFEKVMLWQKETAQQLQQGNDVAIGVFGTLKRQNNQVVFSATHLPTGFEVLAKERVVREGAVHHMLVGDVATNSTAMEAFYDQKEKATDRWWLLPVIVATIAILLIFWAKFFR